MRNRKQSVVLRGQPSSLTDIDAWVFQGSTFSRLMFLIYINNLANDLLNAKLFANDTSTFSVVYNVNTSTDEENNDLVKINKLA